jgi:hypothetical protein
LKNDHTVEIPEEDNGWARPSRLSAHANYHAKDGRHGQGYGSRHARASFDTYDNGTNVIDGMILLTE